MQIIIITIICLFSLVFGAELLMKGAVAIAERIGLSKLVIASTLIAIGMGLPTIAVNVAYALESVPNSEAILGNAIGTNLLNIGLGLGIPAFLLTIITRYEVFEKEIPIYLAFCSLLTVFAMDGTITIYEGLALVIGYLAVMFIIYQYAVREKKSILEKDTELDLDESTVSNVDTSIKSVVLIVFNLIVGILILCASSITLARITGQLASVLGMSEYIVGLTIIGIGTSLPTVFTSIRSAFRKHVDIIIGNVFGGSIANLALGIGIPAIIKDLKVPVDSINDLYLIGVLNIVVIFGLLIEMRLLGKNKTWNWVSGAIMVLLYTGYLVAKLNLA